MKIIYVNKSEKPFRFFGKHTHAFWEIILIIEGNGIETIDGKSFQCHRGSIFCIPPESPHSSSSQDGMRDFCIGFEDFIPIKDDGEPLILTDDDKDTLLRLFDMELENIRRRPVNAKQLEGALNAAVYQFLISLTQEEKEGNLIVMNLKNKMMDHLNDSSFNLGELMDETGFSRGYLRRVFKNTAGESPLSWFNRQRIEFAKQYFRQFPGRYNVREIGLMVGIDDPYYLSKLFKKYSGVSPIGYVKQYEQSKMGDEEHVTAE